jgi:hypothetical protein
MSRDKLHYEPVLDAEGKRITHGKMFLASIPEGMAQAAEQIYRKHNSDWLQAEVAKVQASQEELVSLSAMKRAGRNLDLPNDGIEFLDKKSEGGMLPGEYGHTFKG